MKPPPIGTVDCKTCDGYGTVSYYVGTYGTSSCHGEAEEPCSDCEGYGYVDAD